jgi:hypothetical protein
MLSRRTLLVSLTTALASTMAIPEVARSQAAPGPAARRPSNQFICLPYLGLNQPLVDRARYFPGLRAGSLLGYNLRGLVSLNAELTIDVLKRRGPVEDGGTPSEAMVDFAFSPLVHMDWLGLPLVAGPQLGYFRYIEARVEPRKWDLDDRNFHGDGWAYGFNLGVFFPLNQVTVGALVNYAGHRFRTRCENDYRTNEVDVCVPPNRSDRHLLGLAGALLF